MCTVSMIMDHYQYEWSRRYHPVWFPPILPREIEEFRRLLERAREYDRKHNQPDCSLEAKREALLALAKQLGIEIEFIKQEAP